MHWYKFQVKGSSDLIVCHASRKKDIELALTSSLVFLGCVDKDKIPALRTCLYHTVFNSVNKMLTVMKAVAPELIAVEPVPNYCHSGSSKPEELSSITN